MLGIAVVFGGLSILAADLWIRSQASQRVETSEPSADLIAAAPAVRFGTIVVATEPLRFGARLESAGLREIPWHEDSIPEGAYRSVEEARSDGSRVIVSPIEPNEPVLAAKLSGVDGRATLSRLLSPGMRAVTIRIDEIAGVAGLVAPGDRVDVVMTRDAGAIEEVTANAAGASGSRIASEVVLENARVLGVGQELDERADGPRLAGSVTLEVTPEDARKVALARSIGSLSLSLRSVDDSAETGGGLTTISAFGGSGRAAAGESGSGFLDRLSLQPERPSHATVVVTRGTVTQSYRVVTQDE